MKVYDNNEVQDFRKMEWVDADIAQELYDTLKEIASLYKSDIVPSDDFCWDEVVQMCRDAVEKADGEDQ